LARFFPRSLMPAVVSTGSAQVTVPVDAQGWRSHLRLWVQAIFLTWIFYATSALLIFMLFPAAPLPAGPIRALEPFRIANEFGLFAVMTRARYEIEFQGSHDGLAWTAYSFRNKPQDLRSPPRIYAPYQPRFDWNLWFASLGNWRQYPWVLQVERRLLSGEPDVLSLFAADPFPGRPPEQIRVVLWQYWFTDRREKREQGLWWRREQIGLYAPTLERTPGGKITVLDMPESTQNLQ
jgi:lipase maturation factor 1